MELSSDLKDMSEGEDVFYTYRASVSSKDGEDASVTLVSLSSPQAHFSLAFLSLLELHFRPGTDLKLCTTLKAVVSAINA